MALVFLRSGSERKHEVKNEDPMADSEENKWFLPMSKEVMSIFSFLVSVEFIRPSVAAQLQWWIQDFLEGASTPKWATPTYHLINLSQKPHENDEIWPRGNVRPNAP